MARQFPIIQRIRAIEEDIRALARETALAMEAGAKGNAPWQDDTGAARAGLKGTTDETPTSLSIVLAHSVEYGQYLEYAMAGRYAILWPTVEAELPRLEATLKRLMR